MFAGMKTIFGDRKIMYSKTCVKRSLSKRPKYGFKQQLLPNAGQKYCRMLQGEHSAILLTFITLPFVIEICVLSIFEPLFYTGLRCETGLSPPVKYFADHSKAVLLLWIFYVFVLSCVCYVFLRVYLYVLCGHLLGKG